MTWLLYNICGFIVLESHWWEHASVSIVVLSVTHSNLDWVKVLIGWLNGWQSISSLHGLFCCLLIWFSINLVQEANKAVTLYSPDHMTIQFASYTDGKEAVTKAANLLFSQNLKQNNLGATLDDLNLIESHLNEALQTVGLFTSLTYLSFEKLIS